MKIENISKVEEKKNQYINNRYKNTIFEIKSPLDGTGSKTEIAKKQINNLKNRIDQFSQKEEEKPKKQQQKKKVREK